MADRKAHAHVYDVFLSFRGETRRTFTDHLYYALKDVGVNVFRDDEELRRGEDITSELEKAIQGCKIAVVVFSKDYASSRWCLEELVKIMECRRTLRQLVLPIFYDVDPSDVRKQGGSFEEAFARHQKRFVWDVDRVLGWRLALTDAANLSGWDLRNTADGHEAKFIRLIVEDISIKLSNTRLFVAHNLVGIESRVKAVTSRLDVLSDGVRMVGILGMGGLGKTTIAKAVYNEICHSFEGTCFLANVKEVSEQPIGHVHLQEQLLSAVLNHSKIKVHNVAHGIKLLQERLCHKKVLIVLDDVDQMEQLNALARKDWYGMGSRIIITTRDKHLLTMLEVDAMYIVDEMDETEALELFSWHAFRNSDPSELYYELSKKVVNYCGGLPLALEVLGCFLFGRSMLEWEGTLDKLKIIPNDQIHKKLRISYECLSDHTYKDIFLDISCHLIGLDKNDVMQILDGCGLFPKIGISVLLQRCLLRIDGENKLRMHDLVRDMGREIVREEAPKEPGKRSRIFLYDDAWIVLSKQKGTETVEGLTSKMPISHEVKFKTKAFREMQNIRLLEISYGHLTGDFEHLFQELRWLRWHGFPLKLLPKDLRMGNLVALDLRYSKLKLLWKESKFMEKLRILNLSHSHYLTHTPNFQQLPNLEKLKLKDCKRLVELHHSIRHLSRLVLINLKDCTCLKKLPTCFTKLISLETLIISGCSKLDGLPEDLGDMESLTTLLAENTTLQKLPSTIVRLKKLSRLSLSGSREKLSSKSFYSFFWSRNAPRKHPSCIKLLLPPSLLGLDSLTRLHLRSCNLSNDEIPEDIGRLASLIELDLGDNAFDDLPSSISGLTELRTLVLDDCSNLQCVPDLSEVKRMETLRVSGCSKLVEIPGLDKLLTSIRHISMFGSEKMAKSLKESIKKQGWKNMEFGGMWYPGDYIPTLVTFEDENHSKYIKVSVNVDPNLNGLIVCNHIIARPLSIIKYTKDVAHKAAVNVTNNDVITCIEDHLWQGRLSNRVKWEAKLDDMSNFQGVDFEVKLFDWPEFDRAGVTLLHI